MCDFLTGRRPTAASAPIIANTNSAEASERADIEARLRRRRQGAAANILTSPTGIPAKSQLGAAA